MADDMDTRAGRRAYLEKKLHDLVSNVSEGYGEALLDQLILRLESTVSEFELEITELVERLRQNAATQEELLSKIRGRSIAGDQAGAGKDEATQEDLTLWEKRLAQLDVPGKQLS